MSTLPVIFHTRDLDTKPVVFHQNYWPNLNRIPGGDTGRPKITESASIWAPDVDTIPSATPVESAGIWAPDIDTIPAATTAVATSVA